MRILITGAKGMLGMDLKESLALHHDIHGIDIDDLDIVDTKKVIAFIDDLKPEMVIHLAAYTDVDGCEKDPDKAFTVNTLGTLNICIGCQRTSSHIIYISTDYIFDGNKESPYTEFDEPRPINYYGASKLAGERYITSLLNRFCVIRTSWLYGKNGKNFVRAILTQANQGTELRVVNDQVGSPTYTRDLASAITELIKNPFFGFYHITNSWSCSWYEFATEILLLTNKIDKVKLNPISSKESNRLAKRPRNSVLKNYCLQLQGFKLMRPWKEALAAYLREESII